jgi:Histidine kinase
MERSVTARRLRSAAGLVLLWTAWGLFWSQQEALLDAMQGIAWSWRTTLLRNLGYAWLWIPLTPAVTALARRWPLDGSSRVAWLPHVAAAIAVGVAVPLLERFLGLRASGGVVTAGTIYAFLWSVVAYGAIVGITTTRAVTTRLREHEAYAARLALAVTRARTESLAWRLQPTFVVSALDRVASLAGEDPQRADDATVLLGDYLRHLLRGAGRGSVALAHEMTLIKTYLALRTALGWDDARRTLALPSDLAQRPVAPMSVQSALHAMCERGAADGWQPATVDVEARHGPSRPVVDVRVWWRSNRDTPVAAPTTVTVHLANEPEELEASTCTS